MSIQSIQNSITGLRRDTSELQKRISDESKKEANLSQKMAQLQRSLLSNMTPSSRDSKTRELSRLLDDIAKVQANKAGYQKRLADKESQLHRYEVDLSKEQERERKKIEEADRRRREEQLTYQRKLTRELEAQTHLTDAFSPFSLEFPGRVFDTKRHDVFISHANEDKDDFVRPLAKALEDLGLDVWYDEMQLKVGDSLRRSIDLGLKNSRFGVVVLSSSFFAKNWPQYELDGLVAREMTGAKVVLPIWHKVTKNEVMEYSPTLADKVALNSSMLSIDEIAKQLHEVVKD